MVYKTIAEINRYEGTTVNPMHSPDEIFELYSVPSFDTNYPEIIAGADIGSSKVTVQENDVLICKINPRINRVWVVKHYTEYPLLASSEWIVVRNSDMDADYLRWYFSSPTFRVMLNSEVAGIGGSLTRAQPKRVVQYPVPVCALEEQRYISTVLNRVESLISLRKQQIAKLDELVKARFVEMFGDPATNPMKWKLMCITDVCDDICGGGTPSKSHPEYYEGNIPWVSPKDMKSLVISDSIDHITEAAIENSTARLIPANSVLMVIRSGILKHTLPVAINNVPVAVNQDMKAFMPGKEINASYLMYYFKAIESDVLSGVRAVTADNIDFKAFQKRRVMVPPLADQHQFAAFVAQTDQQKLTIQHSLAKLELLKKALMQKYFG